MQNQTSTRFKYMLDEHDQGDAEKKIIRRTGKKKEKQFNKNNGNENKRGKKRKKEKRKKK